MPQSITFTVSDADAQRVQAACQAAGVTPKALITTYVIAFVQAYERAQQAPPAPPPPITPT